VATIEAAGAAAEDDLDERLPSWALGTAFVVVVAMFPAIVIIALVTDLSEAQMDVFSIAMGIVAVLLGAGLGVAIQAGNVRSARRERDNAHTQRITEVEEERGLRAEAVHAAEEAGVEAVRQAEEAGVEAVRQAEAAGAVAVKEAEAAGAAAALEAEEAERSRTDARIARARIQVLEAVSQNGATRIKTVSAAKLKSPKFARKAKKSKHAFYVKASRSDLPHVVDPDVLADEVALAFDDLDSPG
jgi:hypothetical protein